MSVPGIDFALLKVGKIFFKKMCDLLEISRLMSYEKLFYGA